MALITPFRDEGTADGILGAAERHFARAILALDEVCNQMESGADIPGADVQRRARDARNAMQALFDERTRVDTKAKKDVGIAHDYGLDFDAARAEIGSLLDRLRGA